MGELDEEGVLDCQKCTCAKSDHERMQPVTGNTNCSLLF